MLNADNIQKVDSAALQLLCAFAVDAHHAGITTRWSGANPVVSEAADLLGLSGHLGL